MVPLDTIASSTRKGELLLTVDRSEQAQRTRLEYASGKGEEGNPKCYLDGCRSECQYRPHCGNHARNGSSLRPSILAKQDFRKIYGCQSQLVKDLKNHRNLWEKVKDLIIEKQGDIAEIPGVPQHIKDIYKTSFTTSPYAFIEVAARAQKWIDQAISRNMYLETRDMNDTMKVYSAAWEKGLKSTYYLHLKPRHSAEQSTTHVNKSEKLGKKGFGAFASVRSEIPKEEVAVASPLTIEDMPVSVPVSAPVAQDIPAPRPFAGLEPAPDLFNQGVKQEQVISQKADEPKKYNIVAPSDPSLLNQCDSCQ